jgi:hypothetical protein
LKTTTKTRRVTQRDIDIEMAHGHLEAASRWAGALDDLSGLPWGPDTLGPIAKIIAVRTELALAHLVRAKAKSR